MIRRMPVCLTLTLTLTLTLAFAVTGDSAHAGVNVGVTGSGQNGGTPNTLFEIDTTTGVATMLGTTSVVPNSLAFNAGNNLYYYGDHASSRFYAFDPNDGTDTQIGDGPAGTRFSGPGDFFGNRYYWVAEASSGGPVAGTDEIRWFEFSADGKSVTMTGSIQVTLPTGASGFGDFGDIAINPTNGIMWGSTSDVPQLVDETVGVFTIDIMNVNPVLTIVNANEGLDGNGIQMAFNNDGELFANRFDNRAEILPIDLGTGILGTPVPLVGTSADFFDMATVVPEPTTLALALLGLGGLWSRWRRRS